MAATVSAWAKPGAWALDSEEQEAVETLQKQRQGERSSNGGFDAAPPSDFPSLSAAAATKSSKKKKSQPVSFALFATGKPVTYGAAKYQARGPALEMTGQKGLTREEQLVLPTGPRERTQEELERASSRGFNLSSYGGGGGRREDSRDRWGSSRVSDEPRRGGYGDGGSNGFDRDSGPSRADETDDWGAAKKFVAPLTERRERNGGFIDSQSKADETDDWGAAKKFVAPLTERRERNGGFFDSQSKADESDNWISKKSSVPPPSDGRRLGDGYRERRGGFDMFNREGMNGGSGTDPEVWGRRSEEVNGGRPRIVLQPRSLPLESGNGENRGEQQGSVTRSKGSNPFGQARPREEVLAEKGQDWKKIDEQLESMKIREMGHKQGEGMAFGKKGFGGGSEQGGLPEDRTDRAWRKADSDGSRSPSPSAKEVEEGVPRD